MKAPSRVSNRHMPAVNSAGSTRTTYQGSPAAAPDPASTSRVTSVAASNPTPNSRPTSHICAGGRTERSSGPSSRLPTPRAVALPPERGPVDGAGRCPPVQPHDADERHQVEQADQVEEQPRD